MIVIKEFAFFSTLLLANSLYFEMYGNKKGFEFDFDIRTNIKNCTMTKIE